MARKEGKKAKGAGARALASVAVTLRVTTTPAALNAPLQGASHSPFRLRNCWEGRSVRASSLLRQLAKGGCAARRLSWVTPGFSQSRRCKTTASDHGNITFVPEINFSASYYTIYTVQQLGPQIDRFMILMMEVRSR